MSRLCSVRVIENKTCSGQHKNIIDNKNEIENAYQNNIKSMYCRMLQDHPECSLWKVVKFELMCITEMDCISRHTLLFRTEMFAICIS